MMFEPPEPTDCQHEEILAELGRALYKLLFQLLLLIDSCNKMLSAVTTAAKTAQVCTKIKIVLFYFIKVWVLYLY